MKGFDTKALLLFPKLENYENKNPAYKYQFKKAVSNLVKYLQSQEIEPHVFYTDDVARELSLPEFKWVNPLGPADSYFIYKHCDNTEHAMDESMISYPDITNEVLAKDPGSVDMSEMDRFEMVLRHISKTTAKIIPTYKIVAHFIVPSKAQYRVTSKPNDGKIRINVNAQNLVPKVFISGQEENACNLLGVPYANRCLDVWEVQ